MSGVKKFAKSKPEPTFEPLEPEIEELPMEEKTPVVTEIDTAIEEPKKRRGRPRKIHFQKKQKHKLQNEEEEDLEK